MFTASTEYTSYPFDPTPIHFGIGGDMLLKMNSSEVIISFIVTVAPIFLVSVTTS